MFVIFQIFFFTCSIGVALTGIGVALLEVGVAPATPKVYKPPPLKRTLCFAENPVFAKK